MVNPLGTSVIRSVESSLIYMTRNTNGADLNYLSGISYILTSDIKHSLVSKLSIRGPGQNKLRTYRVFKEFYNTETYIALPMPLKHRQALALFRCGIAHLCIETGRYGTNRIPVNERTCYFCDGSVVENEYHALFNCDLYKD